MSKNLAVFSKFALLFIIIVFGKYVLVAQTSFTGEWKADATIAAEKPGNQDKFFFSLTRRTGDGDRNQNGSTYNYSELKNLTREQALSGGAAKFSIVREAGTIECDGSFTGGKGAGTFRFTANPQFIAEMKKRGFDFEKPSERENTIRVVNGENIARKAKNSDSDTLENRLFAATTINVTTALADDLLSANFGKLDTGDLFKAAIFKIDSNFLKEMKASNFPNLDFDDLVKARIFKIDGEFLRQLNAAGFGNEPFENVVKMRIFKITPEYIKEIRGEGLSNLSIEELTKMKIFNIDRQFIRQAKAAKVELNVESLVRYKIGGWTKRTNVVWN